jgi:hypothetical protein
MYDELIRIAETTSSTFPLEMNIRKKYPVDYATSNWFSETTSTPYARIVETIEKDFKIAL